MSGGEQYDIGSLELVVSRERHTETFGAALVAAFTDELPVRAVGRVDS